MQEYLRIGVIANSHGIKGEVKVYPTTDDPRRFFELDECFIDNGGMLKVHVASARLHKGMVIVKFEEFDDINQIMIYKGKDILVSRDKAVPLEEGENYIGDLIGLKVISDEEEYIGVIEDVLQTGANDVYIVRSQEGREILIPVIKSCVLDVDLESGKVLVHLMPGLI